LKLHRITLLGLCLAVALSFSAQSVFASVQFQIGSGSWNNGSGWGYDSSIEDPTKMGAVFTTNPLLGFVSFSLTNGASQSFTFGSVTLYDVNINKTEKNADLAVKAVISFVLPEAEDVAVKTTAVAIEGLVHDNWWSLKTDTTVDLTIDFTPITVTLADGTEYEISLSDVVFTDWLQTKIVTATVTLVSEGTTPVPDPGATVPEPASLTMWSLFGVIGLVGGWRRKRAA
jgi:hypothetical protein